MAEKIAERERTAGAVEEIALDGFDHIEFFVGNALQACYYYHRGFGFDLIGYRGLETGDRERVSYVLKQDHVTIVLTGSLKAQTAVSEHVKQHGDGVKTVALKARDARKAYETAVKRGAKSVSEPHEHKFENGSSIITASVQTYGDTMHSFVERKGEEAGFLPGFKMLKSQADGNPVGLAAIDHVVGNTDKIGPWVKFYEEVFGFYVYQGFDASDISTQYSALVSKVMSNKSGNVKLPLNEPAEGLRKSQIQEYLDYYVADGVQHIAISTRDIIKTVAELKQRGVDFLTVPRVYYDTLSERVGKIDEDIEELAKLGILVDRESDGYLLQIFTKPVQDRPTLFFEVIQRKGAKGFGKGNFKALFESIERDQALRGNL
ncbi:MAG TPA: 4-hydroxyphenylpyruvate dioxygenase [Planktothrix sp.]